MSKEPQEIEARLVRALSFYDNKHRNRKGTGAMSEPKPLFFPAIRLNPGKTRTAKKLYSASVARMFGRRARVELYIEKHALPRRTPKEVLMDVYSADPGHSVGRKTYALELASKQPDTNVRYEDRSGDLGTVYLPKKVFDGPPPLVCYAVVDWQDEYDP